MNTYKLPNHYTPRQTESFFDDTQYKDEYQNDVYEEAYKQSIKHSYKKILDIGTGSGFKLMKYFSKFETFGADIEPTLSFLKKTYPDRQWGDLSQSLNMEYDLIICSDVIEHVICPDAFLSAVDKIKYKTIVISTPDRLSLYGYNHNGPPQNNAHVREWTMPEFAEYMQEKISIIKHFKSNPNSNTQIIVGEKK